MRHYLPNIFSFWVARDKWHSTYSGRIASLVFNGGQNAYRKSDNYVVDGDLFAYSLGKEKYAK